MRYVGRVAENEITQIGLSVLGIQRPDRFARGGDHLEALKLRIPAIRFTVGVENYHHQHQDVRTEAGIAYGDTVDQMDFEYLAKVTQLNVAVASALAAAPPAPASATLGGAVSSDTIVNWTPVKGAAGYRIYSRRADSAQWQGYEDVTGAAVTTALLKGVIVDDHFVGVAAYNDAGFESIITFAGLPLRP